MRVFTFIIMVLLLGCSKKPEVPLGDELSSDWWGKYEGSNGTVEIKSEFLFGDTGNFYTIRGKRNGNVFSVIYSQLPIRKDATDDLVSYYETCLGTLTFNNSDLDIQFDETKKACTVLNGSYSKSKPVMPTMAATSPCFKLASCVCGAHTVFTLNKKSPIFEKECADMQKLTVTQPNDPSCQNNLKFIAKLMKSNFTQQGLDIKEMPPACTP